MIAPSAAAELRAARQQPVSAEAIEAFGRRRAASSSNTPDILQIVDGIAQITIDGVLTSAPDFWSWLLGLGNTVYSDIQQSLRLAAADASVREVLLLVSSPGGEVTGLFELFRDLEAFAKPIRTVSSCACSAAYAIAALTSRIEATTEAAAFGSIGVATSLYIDDSTIELTNHGSEAKRPDASTEEGRAVVQAELDAYFELFAGAIARGRKTTTARVRADFGGGRTLLAQQAQAAGLIDAITPAPSKASLSARAAVPADSLAGLLATRLDGETSEAYVARCERLLAAMSRPAPTPAPAPTRADLASAVASLQTSMPTAYPSGEPAAAADMLAQLDAMPSPYAAPQAPGEAPTPTSLGAAVARLSELEWPMPTPSTGPAPAAIPAPPGAELAAAIEAEIEREAV